MGCAKITFVSCAAVAAAMMLSSCSIRDETSDEILVQEESEEIILKAPRTKSEYFIQKCIECATGDMSNLAEIVETYNSSFTNSTDYPPNAFLYQRINNHQAFESCALKARLEGDTSAFDSMIVQPNKIARVARYFYAYNQPTQGAYWLQRIINLRGEVTGLEIAGRVFIQDIRTIGIGVQLLEQSARLGNRTAGQMLTGLMTPGSPYYNQLTTNNTNDYASAKDRGDSKKMKETQAEVTNLKDSLENIIDNNKRNRDNAAADAIAAGASAHAQSSRTTSDSKGFVIFDSNAKSDSQATSSAQPASNAQLSRDVQISDADQSHDASLFSGTAQGNDAPQNSGTAQSNHVYQSSRTAQAAQSRDEVKSSGEVQDDSDIKRDIGSGTAVRPSTAKGDASKSQAREYRDDVDIGAPSGSATHTPAPSHSGLLNHTEDILQSSDADLNIPLEVYEQAAKDYERREATTGTASASGTSEPGKASHGAARAQTDKDISEAHKRLLEQHEERLQQAKEKAEAAAAAAAKADK